MLNTGWVRYSRGASQRGRERRRGVLGRRSPAPKRGRDAREHVVGGGLVEGDADVVVVDPAQVDPPLEGRGHHLVGCDPGTRTATVSKKASWTTSTPARPEGGGQASGLAVHPLGDVPQALGAVVHGVHRRDHGEEHLRGADVRGGLLPADVLLARLQGEAVGGAPGGVDRHADQPAGHRAAEVVAGGEEPGVRTAVAERHAEALRRADAHVGALLAGRGEQRARQQVGGDGDEPAGLVHGGDGGGEVAHHPGGARVLQERAEHRGRVERRRGRRRRSRCRSARHARRRRRSSAGASRRRRRTRRRRAWWSGG